MGIQSGQVAVGLIIGIGLLVAATLVLAAALFKSAPQAWMAVVEQRAHARRLVIGNDAEMTPRWQEAARDDAGER